MYATVIPDHDRGDLTLATSNGVLIVGTRDEMDHWPGTTVRVPDTCTPFVHASDLEPADIPATPWDVVPVDLLTAGE